MVIDYSVLGGLLTSQQLSLGFKASCFNSPLLFSYSNLSILLTLGAMSARLFYDKDCSLELLKGKTVVFIGYGNQGRAQALNIVSFGSVK